MSAALPKQRYTLEEYLTLDKNSSSVTSILLAKWSPWVARA